MPLKRLATTAFPIIMVALLAAGGCKSNNPQQAQPGSNPAASTQPPPNQDGQQAVNPGSASPPQSDNRAASQAAAPAPPAPVSVIPAGTHIVVTLGQTISTKTSQPGESFAATVAEPVVVRGTTLIRSGAPASGTVVDAKSAGHFKGQGTLVIRLDSVRVEGHTYAVASSTVDRVEKGKGKRTAALTGGGGGLGAIIGGIAGGGKGALIGGLSGVGAGAAGSAFTGNHELEIPAETRLTFRLERNVPLR